MASTSATRIRLDEVDRQLIAALQLDGRRPYSRLAQELEISESSVRYRVRRLEDAGILQIVGIADPLRIGFDFMALIGVRVRPGAVEDVCRSIAAFAETSYVVATTGSYDVFVEAICRDTEHFTEFLTKAVHAVDGVVEAEAFVILQIHKLAYGWGVGRIDGAFADGDPRTRSRKQREEGRRRRRA